jgi:hypothetical protein
MKAKLKERNAIYSSRVYFLFLAIFLLLISQICFSAESNPSKQVIKMKGVQTIHQSTTFKNVILDFRKGGSFVVKNNASLDIENTTVLVTISPENPNFVIMTSGNLTIKNCNFIVTTSGISPNPNVQSLFQLFLIQQAIVAISDSQFIVDKFYTVGFLNTDSRFTTEGILIKNNTINNFHGGLYLANANHVEIDDNTFINVSYSNIFYQGLHSAFKRNFFLFPGNLMVGNAFDIFNSNDVVLAENTILSGANYGIYIAGGENLLLDSNQVADGASYAIFVAELSMAMKEKNQYITQLTEKTNIKNQINSNITITNNYLGQNRFGLAANTVTGMFVINNIFVQKFTDSPTRLFWTNNYNLLLNVTNLSWTNNLYKEAFTQEVPGDNTLALSFEPFPISGGVTL